MASSDVVLPGSTIGILGSGQLGRMLALAARKLGYRTAVFSEEADSPAGQVVDRIHRGQYDDPAAVAAFARDVDVITYEFENIPLDTVMTCLDLGVPVRPGPEALRTAQDRIQEKSRLRQHGLPTSPFVVLRAHVPIDPAVSRLSYPCLLKTARFGYDGKGQQRVDTPAALPRAWRDLQGQDAILESVVPFRQEVSVLVARSPRGEQAVYPVVLNDHRNLILDVSLAPAPITAATAAQAQALALEVVALLDVEGLVCVEFFVLASGALLINEIAPRTHNSGHWTIEGCYTSQFTQQARAVCNLPLAPVTMQGYAAMANLMGDFWPPADASDDPVPGNPAMPATEGETHAFLHAYGKQTARPGRKMGHVTVRANTALAALQRVDSARQQLTGWPVSPALMTMIRSHPGHNMPALREEKT